MRVRPLKVWARRRPGENERRGEHERPRPAGGARDGKGKSVEGHGADFLQLRASLAAAHSSTVAAGLTEAEMRVFDRSVFMDCVRDDPFGGELGQGQVDGMEAILDIWEAYVPDADRRWLGYCFATAFHETAQEMLPIKEYGKGQGQPYGAKDPDTGQAYYGRGLVQLTWRDNYARADKELKLGSSPNMPTTSCEWYADNQLKPNVAAATMFVGMAEGWFRGDTLSDYFQGEKDDPYNAREIINGDKHIVPSWSNGVSIGNLIKGYYMAFTAALNHAAAAVEEDEEAVEGVAEDELLDEDERARRRLRNQARRVRDREA